MVGCPGRVAALVLVGCLLAWPRLAVGEPIAAEAGSPAASGAHASATAGPPDTKKPNVIWIVLDALRAHNLSSYGYGRCTSPNLDAFAGQGVLFEQHFTQGLWTSISVPTYMTGRYFPLLVHEPIQATEAIRRIPAGELLMPEIMARNGYDTAIISAHSWFSPNSRLWKAFGEPLFVAPPNKERLCYAPFETVNKAAAAWLQKEHNKPFFLYIHTLDTHFPHVLDPPYDQWTVPGVEEGGQIQKGVPTKRYGCHFNKAEQEHLLGLYDGGISYADAQFKVFLDTLDRLGLRENTLVIVGSDHGELLGEDGSLWGHIAHSSDWIMHIPLLMAGPGLPRGKRVAALTENVDIVPTLVELLGLEADIETDGCSLVPLLRQDGGAAAKRYVFSKFMQGGYDGTPGFILRSDAYKYEVNLTDNQEHLWRVPDTVPARTDCLKEEAEIATQMSKWIRTKLTPRWEQYLRLPTSAIYFSLAESIEECASPASALVIHRHDENPEMKTSNKWAYDTDWGWLWAHAGREDIPPLHFTFDVAPGKYVLQVELWASGNSLPSPASSVRIKAEDDREYKIIEKIETTTGAPGWYFVDVGTYTVDSTLNITVEEGRPGHWTMIHAFRLVTIEEGALPNAEDGRVEQLRALGYLE